MRYRATVGSRQISVAPSDNGHERAVSLDGRELHVDWQAVGASSLSTQGEGATHYSALIGAHSYEVFACGACARTLPATRAAPSLK